MTKAGPWEVLDTERIQLGNIGSKKKKKYMSSIIHITTNRDKDIKATREQRANEGTHGGAAAQVTRVIRKEVMALLCLAERAK